MNAVICYPSRTRLLPTEERSIRYLPLVVGLVAVLLLFQQLPGVSGSTSLGTDFYYFYPDSSQNNLTRLKKEVDSFFRRSDFPVRFQPFSHYRDFDSQISSHKPAFVLVPEWYYRKQGKRLGLVPLLRPLRNGVSTYRKVLLTQKHSRITMAALGGLTLAMTAGDEALDSILSAEQAESIKVIYTAKDADALFAVALGQVDVALVAKSTLEAIAGINARITQNVKILAQTPAIALPVLCYVEGIARERDIQRLSALLSRDSGDSSMTLSQFDGWRDAASF